MPGGGAEKLMTTPFFGTGIAESLGEIPLVGASIAVAPVPATPAATTWRPGRHPGRFFVPPPRRAFPIGAAPIAPARGPAIAAVFVMEIESGANVTYEWDSEIIPSYNGLETRRTLTLVPRETYDFATYLDDNAIRTLLSQLVVNAAAASAFGLALEHESLLSSGASGMVVSVPTTVLSDWAVNGQRAIVLAADGSTFQVGVVQSTTTTTITLDQNVTGAAARAGARIMPIMPIYLDDANTLGLYPANAGSYALKGRAVYFGNTSGTWTPSGVIVNTYTDPFSLVVYPVYDVPLPVEGTSPRAAVAGTMTTDFGGVRILTKRMPTVDFMRQILHIVRTDADRQYLKAFTGAVYGRTKAFLLPTWKPDLALASADASSSVLRVTGSAGQSDYAGQWFQSPVQRRLMLTLSDGTTTYVAVSSAIDNGDGTQSLQLDRGITPSVVMVSFLEQCRLDTDAIILQYEANGLGRSVIPVRTCRQ